MSEGYSPGDYSSSLPKIEFSRLDCFVDGRSNREHLGRGLMIFLPAHFEALLAQALLHDSVTSAFKLLNEVKRLLSFRRDQ